MKAGWRRGLSRFASDRASALGLVLLLVLVAAAVFAPILAPFPGDVADFHTANRLRPPDTVNWLGTDRMGSDLFSRILFGARITITIAVVAVGSAVLVGVPIGLVAGYYRGWLDPVISRLTDVLLAFPFLILAVGLAAILGPSLLNATIALGVGAAPVFIRVARGETLALREEDYVRAAVANGAGDGTIIFRHIVPNMTSTLLVQATVTIPAAIIGEAVLSFLGLGVQPPTPSWGVMLADAQSYLSQAPRLAVYPGLAIFICSLSFNLLGDGLRDVLDPRTTR
jgi:peptide/nickel transport system permease protein